MARAQAFERVPFVRAAALSRGAELLAVAEDPGVLVWDLRSTEQPVSLAAPPRRVRSLAFSPDGRNIAAGGADGEVAVWSTSGQLVRRFACVPDSYWAVGWNPSGRSIAAAGESGTLAGWNFDGQELYRITLDELVQGGRPSTVRAHAFTVEGDRLVVASHSGAVVEWAFSSTEAVRVLRAGEGGRPIRALAVGESGIIAAGDNRGVLHLWRGGSAALELVGHVGAIVAVALDPAGRLAATGGDDRAVRVWDTETGRLLNVLRGLNGQILNIAFSSDGSQVVACDGDAVVARWVIAGSLLRHRARYRGPAPLDASGGQGERAWQIEATRHDWETIRCGCSRGARHVPGSFSDLVRARTEEEAHGQGLTNDVEIQGMLFEAAVPVTSMIMAALSEKHLSVPARRSLLDLLATFVDGESYHTEALEGRPYLEEACREIARAARAVLHRELELEPAPGTRSLVAEIIDSIGAA